MSNRLDDLLEALAQPATAPSLDDLEADVWRRIEADRRSAAERGQALGMQCAVAGAALLLGMSVAWSVGDHKGHNHLSHMQTALLLDPIVEDIPLARLEDGL